MNEISNIRIFRWILACLIVFTSYAFIFGIGIASAEEGNITLTVNNVSDYNFGAISNSGLGVDFSKIMIDSSNYNQIESIFMNLTPLFGHVTYATNAKSTTFTISACGSGGGIATYSKASNATAWYFTNPSTVTCSPLQLTYASNIFADITPGASWGANGAISSINPVGITTTGGLGKPLTGSDGTACCIQYLVNLDTNVINHYSVTYNSTSQILFSTAISKSAYTTVNTNVAIENITGSPTKYPIQGDLTNNYNNNNWAATNVYGGGIQLNMSISSGAFTIQQVNITNSGISPPPTPPTVNPLTGVGIAWASSTYALGSIGNVSWIKTTPAFSCDIIRIYDDTDTEKDFLENPADTGFYKTFLGTTGQWKAEYRRTLCVLGFGLGSESVLEIAYTSVNPETPSYILINESVPIGQLVNTTYRIGWVPSGGVSIKTYKSSDVITPENVYIVSNTQDTDITTQIMITSPGLHYVKLCDSLLGCKAQTLTTAFYNGSTPTTNITLSNITMDKTAYSYGDHAQVQVSVDNYNWSNKLIGVYSYNWDYGITQHQQFILSQVQSYDQYISDTTFAASGNYSMRLVGENDTGSYILAFYNFTLAEVDAEGYGLSLSNTSLCVGDSANIMVTVPTASFLNISFDNAVYNKNFYINNSKIVPFKFTQLGTYYITLNSINMEAKRVIIISTNDCVVPTPTVTVSSQTSLDLANLLSTNIFWALIMTVGLMIGVAVAISNREER